jgi:L-serine dehydratase
MAAKQERKIPILDIMGPVMVGPSSSHTAGTARLGRVAHGLLDEPPLTARFVLHPPLARTYRGHGSDFALVGGAIGFGPADARIPEAIRIAEQQGVTIEFDEEDLGEVHPNTVRIELQGATRRVEITGSSIGGAAIEVFNIDGFAARFKGDSPTLFLFYRDRPGMIHEVTSIIAGEAVNIASLLCSRRERGKEAFMQIDIDSPLSTGAVAKVGALEEMSLVRYLDRIA